MITKGGSLLADLVAGGTDLSGVCEDPDGDKYLVVALDGRADFVVTGDQGFLALEAYEGVQIVTPRAFLEILRSEAAGAR